MGTRIIERYNITGIKYYDGNYAGINSEISAEYRDRSKPSYLVADTGEDKGRPEGYL